MFRRLGLCIAALFLVGSSAFLSGCSGSSDSSALAQGPLMFIGTQLKIYSTGTSQYQFLDVNGDGFTDTWGSYLDVGANVNRLAVAYGSATEIFEAHLDVGPGDAPRAGDFDGDGRTDFVVTFVEQLRGSGFRRDVGIYWQEDDGAFSDAERLTALARDGAWDETSVGDFDGDGLSDILLSYFSGAYVTLLSDGAGGFVPFQSTESRPFGLAPVIIDVNVDGRDDVLADAEAIHLSNGDGSFGPKIAVEVPGFPFAGLQDVTGDGIPDAIGGSLSNRVGIRLGNGDGTFGDVVVSELGMNALIESPFGDFNRDGIVDLMVHTTDYPVDEYFTWIGTGGGGFGPVVKAFDAISSTVVRGAADLDRDGQLDVLTRVVEAGNPYTLVHFGRGDGTFRDERRLLAEGRQVRVLTPDGNPAPDFDGDGKDDFILLAFLTEYVSLVHYGDSSGELDVREEPVQLMQFPSSDLDGDGDRDFLILGGFPPVAQIYRFYSRDEITPGNRTDLPENTFGLASVTDIDQDGSVDLLINALEGVGILYGLNGVALEPAVFIEGSESFGTNLTVRDITGDGLLDIVGAPKSGESSVIVFPADSPRSYGPMVRTELGVPNNFFLGHSILDQDFNGDGRTDVAFLGRIDGTTVVSGIMLANADGSFTPAGDFAAGARFERALLADDVDGDGDTDLIGIGFEFYQAVSSPGSSIELLQRDYGRVLLNDGTGTFSAGERFDLVESGISDGEIFHVDLSRDGRKDIVVASPKQSFSVALAQGDGTFGTAHIFWTGGDTDLLFGDYDGDQDRDLVVTADREDAVYYYENLLNP